jgi:triacylglycerol lipase
MVANVILDLTKKINLMNFWIMSLYLLIAPNVIVLFYLFLKAEYFPQLGDTWRIIYISVFAFFIFYLWVRLNIFPVLDGRKASPRLKMMIGGKIITYRGLYSFVAQVVVFILGYTRLDHMNVPNTVVIASSIYAVSIVFILLANGVLRIFFTSKRLRLTRRLIMLFTMWIPFVNVIVLILACRLVNAEYDFECYKVVKREARVDTNICKTKYPIVMVHGIFFKDFKYFNYWGRIPNELIRNGATIYYGNQEAAGTVMNNSHEIKDKILKVIEEIGCEKVNIIAHSKGGLDARYAISMLGMEEHVASLTTMNTPHRGCKFVDKACKLPDRLYKFVAKCFDKSFRKVGDKNPDFYTATRQFNTNYSKEFNEQVKNSTKVYYQSYTSKMKNMFSDTLLMITYCLTKPLEGDNDGLVSVESAKWGDFKGLICNKKHRGISHGDIIDLKREDYRRFDVVEGYVKIVSELKEMGF